MDNRLVWQHDPGFHHVFFFNNFTEIRTGAQTALADTITTTFHLKTPCCFLKEMET